MWEKQTVNFLISEFLFDFDSVVVIVKQAVLCNIIDIHEVNSHFPQLLPRIICILYCCRCTENAPSCRGEPKSDLCHIILHSDARCVTA